MKAIYYVLAADLIDATAHMGDYQLHDTAGSARDQKDEDDLTGCHIFRLEVTASQVD